MSHIVQGSRYTAYLEAGSVHVCVRGTLHLNMYISGESPLTVTMKGNSIIGSSKCSNDSSVVHNCMPNLASLSC